MRATEASRELAFLFLFWVRDGSLYENNLSSVEVNAKRWFIDGLRMVYLSGKLVLSLTSLYAAVLGGRD